MCISNGYNLYAHVNIGEKIEHVFGLVDAKDAREWYQEIHPMLEGKGSSQSK